MTVGGGVPVIALKKAPAFRVDGADSLDENALRLERVPGYHDIPALGDAIQVGAGVDEDMISWGESGKHGGSPDDEVTTTTEQPPEPLRPPARQLAVYHATSRPFVAQKMSWISLTASISSCACTALTSTLTAEQSLAAFQKTS